MVWFGTKLFEYKMGSETLNDLAPHFIFIQSAEF